ncbi:ATPase, T2SS/T4P/T4SS family [[Clostridium] fimetarium]|uniref:Pilus assembly protein CpaF n=1 Tax=[Clostridium] fimetarium TaxID=99656 RepID=A0A1I0QC08_9FIRM|nr:ATPase, T2SS/T4P/T4SS family [[Clostridium] fimetarium]SEW24450.1 pilus assembly protein CpaF [[Clostridium] fimetarium]
MAENKTKIMTGVITKERLKPLFKYLKNDEITDVDWNGSDLWIKNIYNESIMIPKEEHEITPAFIQAFTTHVSNSVSKLFNQENCVLEAETEDYRIECVHEARAISGRCCCIRKTTRTPRMSYKYLIDSKYTISPILNLLINCCIAKFNFMIAGEPGVGKTEFAKFLSLFIPDDQRVITIEDSPEWHYKELKPYADGIELQVNDDFSYTDALKTCMRLNPRRIFLSEVRSTEAKSLIECWSNGVKGFSTLHTDDARKIPDRILNMMPTRADAERLKSNVYENLDIGILINQKKDEDGKNHRYIEQVCFFERDIQKEENKIYMIVEEGKIITQEIPQSKKIKLKGISYFEISDVLKEKYYET